MIWLLLPKKLWYIPEPVFIPEAQKSHFEKQHHDEGLLRDIGRGALVLFDVDREDAEQGDWLRKLYPSVFLSPGIGVCQPGGSILLYRLPAFTDNVAIAIRSVLGVICALSCISFSSNMSWIYCR